jgi:purine nucleosidase
MSSERRSRHAFIHFSGDILRAVPMIRPVSNLRSLFIALAMLVTVLAPVGFAASTAHAASGTPLIVDTDMYSDADDAGALSTAFALQQAGEANVVAVTINTRLNRPEIADNSWKCAAAIAQYYGAGSTPIGIDSPRSSNTASPFTAPCAAKAAADTPTPGNAVTVLRDALAAQPDHSVVIAETGYAKNLADLLASTGGSALVAQKVKMLVIMGGTYLNGNHENNIAGDAGAAKAVSDTWPTKIVWSGSEVGDAVQAGGSISTAQPTTSPVRASYEAFAQSANTSINSWDLTAVYHAVRPNDAALTETGPGKNQIEATDDATYGNNSFVANAGTQYYLTLTNEAGLEGSLNALLNQQPPVTTTTTAPSTTTSTTAPTSTTSTTAPSTTSTTQGNQPADVAPAADGYRLVDLFGDVYAFGVENYGDLSNVDLNAPIVNATRTATGRGYWLLGADGGIFAFGDAQFFGSMGGKRRGHGAYTHG